MKAMNTGRKYSERKSFKASFKGVHRDVYTGV
jgi:hypothetical protein